MRHVVTILLAGALLAPADTSVHADGLWTCLRHPHTCNRMFTS